MSLKDILAAQKAKQDEVESQPDENANRKLAQPSTSGDGSEPRKPAGLAFLKAKAQSESISQPAAPASEAKAETKKAASGGLGFLKSATAKPSGNDAGANAAESGRQGNAGGGRATNGSAIGSLADLESIDLGAVEEARPGSQFDDEITVDKPVRVTEGLEHQQTQFVQLLDGLYEIQHDHDLMGNVVSSIMIELQNNPEYRQLVSPTDVHTMIKGMRNAMGLARIQKESKARGQKGASKSKKQVDSVMLDTLDALLGTDLGD